MKLNQKEKKKLLKAIHFLKIEELKCVCKKWGLPVKGQKADLISRILDKINVSGPTSLSQPASKKFKKYKGSLSSDTHILPGFYTNGSESRKIFKDLIGEHFKFTSFGMDWIRQKWSNEQFPTYKEFAHFWEQENKRRLKGDDFISAPTNARVCFFREQKAHGHTKEKFEMLWLKEREKQKLYFLKTLNLNL